MRWMHRDLIQHPWCGHVTCKEEMCGNIVPHRERNTKPSVYKVGRLNAIALPPQYSNQGPLTCGPFTPQPPCHLAPLTSVHVASCHVSAPPVRRVGLAGSVTWPCVPRRIRAGLACQIIITFSWNDRKIHISMITCMEMKSFML